MVSLDDRLKFLLTDKSVALLDEFFGIRTVDDLLRHYPRSYVVGAAVRGAEDTRPEDGEHITVVDVITETSLFRMKTGRKCLRVTLGAGRDKVTATFFNAEYIAKGLTKNQRVMLSGEVGY